MAESIDIWLDLTNEQRRKEIVARRARKETWKDIALALRGSEKRYQAIWSWSRNNLEPEQIGKGKKNELQNNIVKILHEIGKLQDNQEKKFTLTASFLDAIEERLSQVSKRTTSLDTIEKRITKALNKTAKSRAVTQPSTLQTSREDSTPPRPSRDFSQYSPSRPRIQPPPPPINHAPPPLSQSRVQPPPPPPPSRESTQPLPSGANNEPPSSSTATSTGSVLRTDFENMNLEDFRLLPTDFLVSLSTADRTRVQERVKELKMLEKMTELERDDYLAEKEKEKEKKEASKDLGGSLKAMLSDNNSLFAKMRKAADQSGIAGKGTFGDFFTDYVYSYCFSCGKTLRSENTTTQECQYCGANSDLVIHDEEKTSHKYYECLDCKAREWVDPSFSRGTPIIIRSRWKRVEQEDSEQCPYCTGTNIHEITSSVLVSEDPDKQFSYYMTLFRLYQQLQLPEEFKDHVWWLSEQLQALVDVGTREQALSVAKKLLERLSSAVKWVSGAVVVRDHQFVADLDNMYSQLSELNDPESGLYLQRMNEIAQINGKMDQLINQFTNLTEKMRHENLL
ncbi:MAG: hypothetical protein ACFFD4_34790 [Candidatus Odinarchaeota archaeon]